MNAVDTLVRSPALTAFLEDVAAEARGAQLKFPGNAQKVAATGEEFGELCKALLEHSYGKGDAKAVYAEAVQLAAMAAQLALGGSDEFPYVFDMAFHTAFVPTGGRG